MRGEPDCPDLQFAEQHDGSLLYLVTILLLARRRDFVDMVITVRPTYVEMESASSDDIFPFEQTEVIDEILDRL